MSNLNALLVTVLLSSLNPAVAKELFLHCQGSTQGDNIRPNYEPLDIQVNVISGNIFGFPGYQAPGCIDISSDRAKVDVKVTENTYETDCKNSISSSNIRLNRFSGALTITTFFSKENTNWSGRYMCAEQRKRF